MGKQDQTGKHILGGYLSRTKGNAQRSDLFGAALLALAPVGSTESPVRRGAYLVNVVGACGRCHSPRDAEGKPVKGQELSGGFEFDDGLIGHVVGGPNITPHPCGKRWKTSPNGKTRRFTTF